MMLWPLHVQVDALPNIPGQVVRLSHMHHPGISCLPEILTSINCPDTPQISSMSLLILALQAMVAAPQGFNVSHMLQPALSVLVSMGLGAVGGAALGALLNAKPATLPRPFAVLGRSLPQPVIARYLKGLYCTTSHHAHLCIIDFHYSSLAIMRRGICAR